MVSFKTLKTVFTGITQDKKDINGLTCRTIGTIFFFLLSIVFLSRNIGIIQPEFSRFCGFILLLSVFVLNFPFKQIGIRQDNKDETLKKFLSSHNLLGFLLIIISIIILFFTNTVSFWLICATIFILGIIFLTISEKIQSIIHVLLITSFIYTIFMALYLHIPWVWYSIQKTSLFLSSFLGIIFQGPMQLGPSVSGFMIYILMLVFIFSIFFLTERNLKGCIYAVIGIGIAYVIYYIFLTTFPFETASGIANSQYVAFILSIIPAVFLTAKSKFRTPHMCKVILKKDFHLAKSTYLVVVCFIIFSTFLTIHPLETAKDVHVVLYGGSISDSWIKPNYNQTLGLLSAGAFGLLPDFINSSANIATVLESNITKDILKNTDILVLINLNHILSQEAYDAIWHFVNDGGSLLVMGDHTDLQGFMVPSNLLLKPVGIKFRFDSGYPLNDRWVSCLQFLPGPVTSGLQHSYEIDISVGSSLNLTNISSFPIVIGKYGYSDWGDRYNTEKAFLGDYLWTKNEQIGDVILVAGARYGRGRVAVFGDTSPFQNLALPTSSIFIQNTFNWLSGTSFHEEYLIILSLIFLIIFTILCYFYGKKHDTDVLHIILPVAVCFSLFLSGACNTSLQTIYNDEDADVKVALIDASHLERINLQGYMPDSITGLMLNLARNGYISKVMWDFSDNILSSDIVVFIAPTIRFNEKEVLLLKQFMLDGGLVILASGYYEIKSSYPLLKEYDLDILNIPLGSVPYEEVGVSSGNISAYEPQFVGVWPIEISDFQDVTIFYKLEIQNKMYPLVVFKKIGLGGLLIIGDSNFLLDTNIEELRNYHLGNIIFLRNILNELTVMEVLS